jgi:hypothetical protein
VERINPRLRRQLRSRPKKSLHLQISRRHRPGRPSNNPPQPPTVTWDGKRLTIDADNSRLADILVAVRDQIHASIEIPGAASAERVFVHLGPGPARDILSDLLYGTPFDYIVEAADDDPDTLRKVVLTARGQSDSSSDVVVAGAANPGEGNGGEGSTPVAIAHGGEATDGRARPGMRMMPGWASSGKTVFQADAEAAAERTAKEQESAAPPESSAAQDSADTQDPTASQEPRPAQDSVAAAQSSAAADPAEGARASNSSNWDNQSGVGQAIQNMTRMFEQRRQIQAQQNQPSPPSSN